MHTLRFLQWNIWFEEPIENILKQLREINADIICLQEITTNSHYNKNIHTGKYLAKKLDLHYFFEEAETWASNSKKDAIGNVILSKFPIHRTDFLYIQKPQHNTQNFEKEGRVYIEVDLMINNKIITVGTTHMTYIPHFISTPAKEAQTDMLINHLKTKKNKFIFSGDLNSIPESYTVQKLNQILNHVGPDVNKPTWTTKPFHFKTFDEVDLKWRLDYVFASSDVTIHSAQIVPTEYSDHLPILVEVTF